MSFQNVSVGASSPRERRAGTTTPAEDPSMQMLDGNEHRERTEQLSAAPEAARNGGMDLAGERAAVDQRVWMPMDTEHGETVPVNSRRQRVATDLIEERLLTSRHRVKEDPPVIEIDERKFGSWAEQFTRYARRYQFDQALENEDKINMMGPTRNVDDEGNAITYSRQLRAHLAWDSLLRACREHPHIERLIEQSLNVKSAWLALHKRHSLAFDEEIKDIERQLHDATLEGDQNPMLLLSHLEHIHGRAQRIGYDMHEKRIMHCFLGALGEEYDGITGRAGDSTEAPLSKAKIISLV